MAQVVHRATVQAQAQVAQAAQALVRVKAKEGMGIAMVAGGVRGMGVGMGRACLQRWQGDGRGRQWIRLRTLQGGLWRLTKVCGASRYTHTHAHMPTQTHKHT